jgi:hypothetical protein
VSSVTLALAPIANNQGGALLRGQAHRFGLLGHVHVLRYGEVASSPHERSDMRGPQELKKTPDVAALIRATLASPKAHPLQSQAGRPLRNKCGPMIGSQTIKYLKIN